MSLDFSHVSGLQNVSPVRDEIEQKSMGFLTEKTFKISLSLFFSED